MTTKIEIDSKIAISLEEIAKNEDKSINDILKEFVDEKRIFNDMVNKNTYGKGDSEDIAGIIDLGYKTDAVKLVKESRELH